MKIVIIGAGSVDFGRGQVADILQAKEFIGQNLTLSLVDINEKSLKIMGKVAKNIKSVSQSDVQIETQTDRRKALPDADFVLTAVARKRYELWEQDYRIPRSYGFNHCLGENGGPGALFHALRSFEILFPIAKDIEELCPNALLMNFTNPEARVLHALSHLTNIKVAGFCHGIPEGIDKISKYLDVPQEDLEIVAGGMNHFYNFQTIKNKKTGKDLREKLKKIALKDKDPHLQLWRRFIEIFDVISYPSDDHIGEYVAYGSEYIGNKWEYGQENKKVLLTTDKERNFLEEYANGEWDIDDPVMLKPSGEITVDVILDILLDRKSWRSSVNVINTGKYIENLPSHAVVEVPAIVDKDGLHPQKIDDIPEELATYMRTHYSIHKLLTEAYKTRSKKLLLKALLLDPNVNSIENAKLMLDEMLSLQSDFLGKFN